MLNLAVSSQCEFRPARKEDIPYIAANMRESDRVECMASSLLEPEAALTESFEMSETAWTGLYKGKPEIMVGVARLSILSEIGFIWMLSTTTAEKNAFLWARFCRPAIDQMLARYDRLENYIDTRNRAALRWAKWLGFEIGEPIEYGPIRRKFHPIALER